MKILFVWPRDRHKVYGEKVARKGFFYSFMSSMVTFPKPLTFPILAAVTPGEHEIRLIEGSINDVINLNEKFDVAGITCATRYAYSAYEIADELRSKGISAVLGGYHPSALPDEAKEHADAVVIGEAEETWPVLLKDFQNNQLKPFYYQSRPIFAGSVPSPLNIYPEKTNLDVQATRGCPNKCEFCSITNMKHGHVFRTRSIDSVVEDIKSIKGKNFGFIDNSLTINPSYTKELFKRMINEGIDKTFSAMGNIDVLGSDEEFLHLSRGAGCHAWAVGLESVSQDSLDSIGKKTNVVEQYPIAIKKIHDYGMIIIGSFVFGFDNDTIDIFGKTDDFVRKSEIDIPDASILTPYPGTPLFDKLDKEGRILTKDWSKYNFNENVVFQPKNMTPDELRINAQLIWKKWYTKSAMTQRLLKTLKIGVSPFKSSLIHNLYMKSFHYMME